MNHTPAPWQVILQDEDSGDKWFDIWSPTYGSVAHLAEQARTDEGLRFLRADAQLIARSPELLQAALYAATKMREIAQRIFPVHALAARELVAEAQRIEALIQQL